MSDLDLSAAVEAAAEREWNRKNAPRTWASDITPSEATPALRKAKRYVAAAAPLIEAAAREQATRLEPWESIALTVATAQLDRGEAPTLNIAAACIGALARIARGADA